MKNKIVLQGIFNNNTLELISNEVNVSMINALKITLDSNKPVWRDGYLKYIIKIENNTLDTYNNLLIEDILDKRFITFIDNSITCDNDFTYKINNNILHININTLKKQSVANITFYVKKKINDFFILSNLVSIYNLESNIIKTLSPIKGRCRLY